MKRYENKINLTIIVSKIEVRKSKKFQDIKFQDIEQRTEQKTSMEVHYHCNLNINNTELIVLSMLP